MAAARPTPGARVRQVIPILTAPDVAATVAFYVERLGFEQQFGVGEPPRYAVVQRDGQIVHFRQGEAVDSGSAGLYMWVDGLDAFYRACLDRQVPVANAPAAQPYGMTEFSIRDLNGVAVTFGEELD